MKEKKIESPDSKKKRTRRNVKSAAKETLDLASQQEQAETFRQSEESRKVIILAAHDDGSGAHVAMCRVRDGLVKAAVERGENLLILYLNGGSYTIPWAQKLWSMGNSKEWAQRESLDVLLTDKYFDDKEGVWIHSDNILVFAKAHNGSLDVPGTRDMLSHIETGFDAWPFQIRNVWPQQVSLTIEMGVAPLTKWARLHNIPSLSVGDTFWSRTLLGSLKGAGEFDEEMEKAIYAIAQCERYTTEAWLFPVITPRGYCDFLSEAHIPFHHIPGFFGSRPTEQEIAAAKSELNIPSGKKLVVMSSGRTKVWEDIYKEVGDLVENTPNLGFVLLYPAEGGLKLRESQKPERTLPQRPNLLPLYANADLGITRGGITIIDFIASEIPFVVVQEPNHWLSQNQQAAASEEGLCHAASLSLLQDESKVLSIIAQYLNSPENRKMKARQRFFDFGLEGKWAAHLLEHYAL